MIMIGMTRDVIVSKGEQNDSANQKNPSFSFSFSFFHQLWATVPVTVCLKIYLFLPLTGSDCTSKCLATLLKESCFLEE